MKRIADIIIARTERLGMRASIRDGWKAMYWVRFKPAVNCTPTTPLLSDVGFEWSGKVASKQTSHFVDNSLLPSAVPFVDVDYRLQ
ncbi:hypothetical protein AX768_30880 (plasmid) [Burkholderia sp. PAMC 28687]|nr:hypothetical protein AX768_30880 [Burkholderia sp. PAMC 28687]